MARRRQKRTREPVETVDYVDGDGNVLTMRQSLSAGTIAKIAQRTGRAAASHEDEWRRRTELLFERLVAGWEIAGLPLEDQKLLLARYRMADAETQQWVRRTISEHVERYIPELELNAINGAFDAEWLASASDAITARAERELEALVAVSSPSGDLRRSRGDLRGRLRRCCPPALESSDRSARARDTRPTCSRPWTATAPAGCCCSATSTPSSLTPITARSRTTASGWWARVRST